LYKCLSLFSGNKAYYPNHKDEEKSPLMAIKDAEEEYGKSEDEIVDVEIFDDFGWYDNRPVSFWFENLLYLVSIFILVSKRSSSRIILDRNCNFFYITSKILYFMSHES
jgi:hypothetical protein